MSDIVTDFGKDGKKENMFSNEKIYNMEENNKTESIEQRENAPEKDMPALDYARYVGMEDVFEANENAEKSGNTNSELCQETMTEASIVADGMKERKEVNTEISLDASSSNELKNLQHKLDVAQNNLEHAQKRLKVLLSDADTPGNLIRDREYQIKVYQKEIRQLQKDIKKEMERLEKLEDE